MTRLHAAPEVTTGLAKIAALLNESHDILAKSNADAQLEAEQRLEQTLRDYIDNHGRRYAYGGIVNLVASIARICEERSALEGDSWECAAIALDECSSAVDLKYDEPR